MSPCGGLDPGPGPGPDTASSSSSRGIGYGPTWSGPEHDSRAGSDWARLTGPTPNHHPSTITGPRTASGQCLSAVQSMPTGLGMNQLGGGGGGGAGWDYDYEDYLRLEELNRLGGVGLVGGGRETGNGWMGSGLDERGMGGGYGFGSGVGMGMEIR
jgi:hypothetical protein